MADDHLKGPLDLDFILNNSCWDAEDFADWHLYEERENVARRREDYEYTPYQGDRRYTITSHCDKFVIVARLRKNGTYQIKDFIHTKR